MPTRRVRFVLSLGLLVAASCVPVPALAQQPLNLGFERVAVTGEDRPWGWGFGFFAFAGQKAADFSLDDAVYREGARSLRIALADSIAVPELPQSIQLQVPAEFARGRTLQLSGWLRAERLNGRASLELEAWADFEVAAADSGALVGGAGAGAEAGDGAGGGEARAHPPQGWERRSLSIRVPDDGDIHSIVVRAALEGRGTAWFDGLELTVDGRRIESLPARVEPPDDDELDWLALHSSPLVSVEPPLAAGSDARSDPELGAGSASELDAGTATELDAGTATELGAGSATDLDRFDDIIGGASIVALGESTHGTREFFTLKHRLLRHLVRAHGFTVFAIEANQLAVQHLDRYIRFGEDTAREAMRAMFAVWNTESMLELVEWLRTHNLNHPDRMVRFIGYDMQDHRGPLDSLRAFLEEAEPSLLPRVESLAAGYGAERSMFTPQIADSVRQRWRTEAEDLADQLTDRKAAWLARAQSRSDSLRIAWAAQSGELLRQATALNETLNSPDRDRFMADNFDWALLTLAPGEKAVIWAHDVHVSRGGDPDLSFNAGEQMGAYLASRHGDVLRTFSLLTYDGAYTATRSFQDHTMVEAEAFPGPSGSLEEALHRMGRPAGTAGWIVDLRPARSDAGGAWLRVPRPLRHVGYAAYDYGFEMEAVFPLEFDGVLFVDRTTASRPLTRR